MEMYLTDHHYFVGEQPTIADISLFAYTHVAGEGGFDLHGYPAITQWLHRIQQLPGFIPMLRDHTPT